MKTKSLQLRELVYINHTRNALPVTTKDGQRFGPGELFLSSFQWEKIFEHDEQLFNVTCFVTKVTEQQTKTMAAVQWPDWLEFEFK